MNIGDTVRTTRELTSYVRIPAGTVGTVTYVSGVTHATANGGGFDVIVTVDNAIVRDALAARLAELAATDSGFYTPEYVARNTDQMVLRSTDLEVIA